MPEAVAHELSVQQSHLMILLRQLAVEESQRLHKWRRGRWCWPCHVENELEARHHHANDWEQHVGLLDDPSLLEPMRISSQFARGGAGSGGGGGGGVSLSARKERREQPTSTVVSERVYMALQRGPSLSGRLMTRLKTMNQKSFRQARYQ